MKKKKKKKKFEEEVCGVDARFRDRLRNAVAKKKQGKELEFHDGEIISLIKVYEIEDAEREIIKAIQLHCFNKELLSLKSATRETANQHSMTNGVKKSSSVYKLDPVLSRGLICVRGHLQRSPISEITKHPAKATSCL